MSASVQNFRMCAINTTNRVNLIQNTSVHLYSIIGINMNFHALRFARSGGRCSKRAKPEVLTFPEGRREFYMH